MITAVPQPSADDTGRRRVAILGQGRLGRYLADKIANDPAVASAYELAFVWDHFADRLEDGCSADVRLTGDLGDCVPRFVADRGRVDLFIEASHPSVIWRHGAALLEHGDVLVSSLTALTDEASEAAMRATAAATGHVVLVPTGAGWGLHDIAGLDRAGRLRGLIVTMSFPAQALQLQGTLAEALDAYRGDDGEESRLLYEGPIRPLAREAPNNVNTMAALWLAAASLEPDAMVCRLVARKDDDTHSQRIEVQGPNGFAVTVDRHNPARKGAVTGDETFGSFLRTMLTPRPQTSGFHFC